MRFSFPAFPAVCCFAVLSLSACTGHPNPMARGYVSYDEVYKSAPGPKAHNIGYEYSYESNKAVLKDIRYVARDLVEKLDKKLAMNIDEVYLKIQNEDAFYSSFDHALREELTKHGYMISQSPVNTLNLDFIVVDDLPECTGVKQEEQEGAYKKFFLGLAINVAEGMPQDMIGDYYEVPTYDFWPGDNAGIKLSLCPEEEQVVDITQAIKNHEEISNEKILNEEVQQKPDEQKEVSDIIPELLEAEQTNTTEETPQ